MEIDRSLDRDPKFTRPVPMLLCETHRVCTKSATIATRRLPAGPNVDRTGVTVSRDDCVARQRALVGHTIDNQQWSDSLSDPSSHQ